MSYTYPLDTAIEAVLKIIDMYGIPCEVYKPIKTVDEMNRPKFTYGEPEDDEILVMQPYPLGEKTYNSGAGRNNLRELKLLSAVELTEYDRIDFFGVKYEVVRVESQGRDCDTLYQVFLKEV